MFLWTRRSYFSQIFEVFWPKVWKYFAQNSKNFWKEKQKKLFFPQILLLTRRWKFENHAKGFCRKSKMIQNFRKNFRVTNCSSGHAKGSFDHFLKFFGRKSEKIFAENPKKFWKEKSENCFFRKFYSGHLDRILRNMPKVPAENPKGFKPFLKKLKPQVVPLDTQKFVFTNFWSFLAKSLKIFCSKFEKKSEKKNKKKTISSAIFTLDT